MGTLIEAMIELGSYDLVECQDSDDAIRDQQHIGPLHVYAL